MAKQKPVRVNLSTKADEILATMREEIPVAYYHFRKPYGGRRKYMKAEDDLLNKALVEKESQMTDMSEYISRVGNRWMTYTMVDYYPKAHYANATHISFIYYETYGSCGAFFPLFRPDNVRHMKKKEGQTDGVMIFTSHFFQRMSERTGKAYRSRELIQEFISTKSTQVGQYDDDGEVIVKFKGGYGFGVVKSENPQVVEIRTYLTDGQLSPKQRRKVENVDSFAELMSDGMYLKDVAMHTTINTYNTPDAAAANGLKKLKALKKLGMEEPFLLMSAIHLAYVRLLEDILHIEVSIPQGAVIANIETECGVDSLVRKYTGFDARKATKAENDGFTSDLVDFYAKVARKMKLKSVTRDAIVERINELMSSSMDKADKYAGEI